MHYHTTVQAEDRATGQPKNKNITIRHYPKINKSTLVNLSLQARELSNSFPNS